MTAKNFTPGDGLGPMRSVLFVPAHQPRRVARALASEADVVVLDLEDSVPVAEKEAARAAVVGVLAQATHPRLYVRSHHPRSSEWVKDLGALKGGMFEGLVLPKIDHSSDISTAEADLAITEVNARNSAGALRLLPIIETARGVVHVNAIAAASSRNLTLIFGAADYSLDLDLSLQWGEDELELLYARSRIAHACRAANIEAPIDMATLQVRDLEGFMASARNGRRLGFQGKLCLHPDQIPSCHEVFTPTAAQIEQARRILAAFEAAVLDGHAAIEVDGAFVDEPIAERARRVIRRSTTRSKSHDV